MKNKTQFLDVLTNYYRVPHDEAIAAWRVERERVNQFCTGGAAAVAFANQAGYTLAQPLPDHLKPRTLSSSAFAALAQLVRMQPDSKSRRAAALVMVDGWSECHAAREVGLKKVDVIRAVGSAWESVKLCKEVVT